MGELAPTSGGLPRRLLSQHLVGRGAECALRLAGSYVSSQHALIRWNGDGWECLDRGSRNGTRIDGTSLEPGRPHALTRGASLTFGHPDEAWVLSDATGPEAMVVALEDGASLLGTQGLIGLPSPERPECTLYRDVDGSWKVELADGTTRDLADGETLETGGKRFRVCLPSRAEATASLGESAGVTPPTLRFGVSSDEEFVKLEIWYGARQVTLGARAHNYLLLTLARSYLADQSAGVPAASCGWIDKEQLALDLKMSPEQVDGEVFRVRKHFARHGLKEAATVIQRRARTRQIRLGIDNVVIAGT